MKLGFPDFLTPIPLSTPANATPYITGYRRFCSEMKTLGERGRLLDGLDHALETCSRFGVTVEILLVGGSFLDLSNPSPADIDCLMFYRQIPSAQVQASSLAELQNELKPQGADVRFIPLDCDPLIVMKTVSYFTSLYAHERSGGFYVRNQRGRGLVLVDCRTNTNSSGADARFSRTMGSKRIGLDGNRIGHVVETLRRLGARTVLDCGCGEGHLLRALLDLGSVTRIVGMDVAEDALAAAARRLELEQVPAFDRQRIELVRGSLTDCDDRLTGFDAAAVVEVIEHMDAGDLPAFEQALFGHARPGAVIVTTPNREYNALFPRLGTGQLRHPDHRFEWTRAEFQVWAVRVAQAHAYEVSFAGIGNEDPVLGAPTQMAVFTRVV